MTIISTLSRLAAAIAGLLFLAPITQAEAKSGGGVKSATAAIAAYGYNPPPVIRDRRKNPQPWSLPRHYHRHDRRH